MKSLIKLFCRLFGSKSVYCPNGEKHSFSYKFAKGGGRNKTCIKCGYSIHID